MREVAAENGALAVTGMSAGSAAAVLDDYTRAAQSMSRPHIFSGGHRILIVSSNRRLLGQCHRALSLAMFRVKSTRSKSGAEKLLASFDPHLVIVDTALPQMQAFELLNQLKGDDELYRLPIVLLTDSPPSGQSWGWGTGKDAISGYLVKLFQPHQLVRLVTYLLASSQFPQRFKFATMDGREIPFEEARGVLTDTLSPTNIRRRRIREHVRAELCRMSDRLAQMTEAERAASVEQLKKESNAPHMWGAIAAVLCAAGAIYALAHIIGRTVMWLAHHFQ